MTTLLKNRLCHKWFPVKFAKLLRTLIFTEHHQWPILGFLKGKTIFGRCEFKQIQVLKKGEKLQLFKKFKKLVYRLEKLLITKVALPLPDC